MSTDVNPAFKSIDDALGIYYQHLNTKYRDTDGKGVFLKYIIDEELDDPELPIECELGDNCNPYDCAYSWMIEADEFPTPCYAEIPSSEKEAFVFYILQYCYKHNEAPCEAYIQQVLIPKCNGKLKHSTHTTPQTEENPDKDNSNEATPVAYADTETTLLSDPEHIKQRANEYIDDIEGMTPCGISNKRKENVDIIRLKNTAFKPKYPARAHLNVFTSKETTLVLRDVIQERFEENSILYYYTDLSTAFQMNDGQMKEFTIMVGDHEEKLSIINYDLHIKGQPEEFVYGIVIPNDSDKVQQDKWLWKLDGFMTQQQIFDKYKILSDELPQSSRLMLRFQKQLRQTLVINESLVDDTNWFSVQQIKSLKRNMKSLKVIIAMSKEMWINECKEAFKNVDLPLIPIVVNKNNNHWIEWVKIVHISSQNIYVGISCKYDECTNDFSTQSICLDRGDIWNKHRLVGFTMDTFKEQLKNFKTSITEIQFTDNGAKSGDKKFNVLKQQIRCQQDSIVRLKEALATAKTQIGEHVQHDCKQFKQKQNVPIQQYIQQFIQHDEDDADDYIEDEWLNQIVDEVIKPYNVLDFKTNPIGAKKNIYIDKQITKLWMKHVTPCFNNDITLYYWLDYTTAMQMCHGYSKQYIHKQTKQFIMVIINYELRNISNKILYGIVYYDDGKSAKDKYPYRLKTFMTKEQIKMEFGIHSYDLPKRSRRNKDFISKLTLERRMNKRDLDKISWSNLKLYKSQATNNDPIHKSVTITQQIMMEYCVIALERLNSVNSPNGNDLIPIVVIDKHRSYYAIEWVLIVYIIHRNCDVGVSFRYQHKTNTFVATAIYLDKGEIEAKHKLIGLTHDYCKHLRSFSLRKFRFKSDINSIIDDEDNTAIHGQNEHKTNKELQRIQKKLEDCQKLYESEKIHVQKLRQEIQHVENVYVSRINVLKQQHQQYVVQQQQQQQQAAVLQQQQASVYRQYQQQHASSYTNHNYNPYVYK